MAQAKFHAELVCAVQIYLDGIVGHEFRCGVIQGAAVRKSVCGVDARFIGADGGLRFTGT